MTELAICEVKKVLKYFNSYINSNFELILIEKTNRFIDLNRTKFPIEIVSKVIEYVSRDCYKTLAYENENRNNLFHLETLNKLNFYLGTDFTKSDAELIYNKLGNGVNRKLTEMFIMSGFDLNVLK